MPVDTLFEKLRFAERRLTAAEERVVFCRAAAAKASAPAVKKPAPRRTSKAAAPAAPKPEKKPEQPTAMPTKKETAPAGIIVSDKDSILS